MVERTLDFEVDKPDRYGRTALMWAAEQSHVETAATLLDLGADRRATDQQTCRHVPPSLQHTQMNTHRRVCAARKHSQWLGRVPTLQTSSIHINNSPLALFLIDRGPDFHTVNKPS